MAGQGMVGARRCLRVLCDVCAICVGIGVGTVVVGRWLEPMTIVCMFVVVFCREGVLLCMFVCIVGCVYRCKYVGVVCD